MLRLRVPIDPSDTEVTVTLTDEQIEALRAGRDAHARVDIDRECGGPASAMVKLERVAA